MVTYTSIRPCKVVIEQCPFISMKKDKRKKTKKKKAINKTVAKQKNDTIDQVLANDLCTPNKSVSNLTTRKVILKNFGDKIIAVICNKRQSQDAQDLARHPQNLSAVHQESRVCFIDDNPNPTSQTEISTAALPTQETPESYYRMSFGILPKQHYINDVSLSNSSCTPVLQLAKKSTLTDDSPITNGSLDISTNLFQELADVNLPILSDRPSFEPTITNDDDITRNIADHKQDLSTLDKDLDETDQSMELEEDPTLFRVAESLLLLSQSDSNYKFCVRCKGFVSGVCKIHGEPMDRLNSTKAVLTLPATMSIQKSSLPGAGLGVFALAVFEAGSLFGPMDGERLTKQQHEERGNNPYVWEVYTEGRKSISHYLDCMDEEKSNWMRFVNCARFEEEQNLVAEQYDNLLFYKAYKRILPGQELLSWYGNAYGRQLRLEHSCPVNTDPIGSDDEYGVTDLTGISSLNNDDFGTNPVCLADISYVTDNDQDLNLLENITVGTAEEEGKDFSSESPSYQCGKCFALFASEDIFKRHQFYICSGSREFKCDVCCKIFKTKRSLRHHIKNSHENKVSYQCPICLKVISTKSNLTVHLKTHSDQRSYKCEECGKLFTRNTFLQSHIRSVHRKERPYICKVCGKRFARSDYVLKHMRLHDKKCICLVCGGEFLSNEHLSQHLETFHKENNSVKTDICPICGDTFGDVDLHQIFVHKRCVICQKDFKNARKHLLHRHKSNFEPGCT